MVIILGDLIADLSIRISEFPITAQDLKPISYLEIGPGGATNIAIMAARFGMQVACLGEVGHDSFGETVLRGLQREGIDTRNIISSPETKTPVAAVVVDRALEPAYLGYIGNLLVRQLPAQWRPPLDRAQALFADGWIEIPEMAQMILDGFQHARTGGVKTFFDPGPGNGGFDNTWHRDAASLSSVLLVNEEEAKRLANLDDPDAAALALLGNGSELVVLKRGSNGLTLFTPAGRATVAGLDVLARDLTGAGDSVTGAIIYGCLTGMELEPLSILANATGATKVTKLGTGHNMPTLSEIRATLEHFAPGHSNLIPA